MKKLLLLQILLLSIIVNASSQARYFYANVNAAQEVPTNSSTATGVVVIKYDPSTLLLQLWGDYQNLSGTISASHIHSPAAPGSNAGVIFGLTNSGGTSGTLFLSATLSTTQQADLYNGLFYVNVHSSSFPGGEIRGQVLASSTTQSRFFTGRLQGAQETPVNNSAGKGQVHAILDESNTMIYLTGDYNNLSGAMTAGHIHNGAPTVAGGVIVGLSFTPATTGVLHLSTDLMTNSTVITTGNGYVNIHTSAFGGGEIRAQLIEEDAFRYAAANINAAQEVPTNGSTATGIAIVSFNAVTKELKLQGTYTNLSGTISASHIHGPAGPGVNAGVIFGLTNTGGTSGTLTLTTTISDPQAADFLAGLWYVNVHSSSFPGGEVRGQLIPTASGRTSFFKASPSASQEVPANASMGSGEATMLLEQTSDKIWIAGSYSSLTSNVAAAHIHQGAVGVNGGVLFGLNFTTSAAAGTVNGTGTVTPAQTLDLINGNSYLNVHTANNGGGEIRGQFGNLVLPVTLTNFTGVKNNGNVELNWTAENENSILNYEIQKQDVNGNWSTIGKVVAINTATTTSYNFIDVNASTSKTNILYRLKINSASASEKYSNVVIIKNSPISASITIMGNPVAGGVLKYQLSGGSLSEKSSAMVVDTEGRILVKYLIKGSGTQQIPLTNIAAGNYYLIISDGEQNSSIPFIKL